MSWRNNKDLPIPIRRRTKDEINKAIEELEGRGFELIFGPKEMAPIGYSLDNYDHRSKKYLSKSVDQGNYWVAKLKRKEEQQC